MLTHDHTHVRWQGCHFKLPAWRLIWIISQRSASIATWESSPAQYITMKEKELRRWLGGHRSGLARPSRPKMTKKRSPGPGPIRKVDRAPVANKHLANRKPVLRPEGARAYKLKVSEVMRCNVERKKKQMKVGNKAGAWLQTSD